VPAKRVSKRQTVLVIDYGSQYTQLIARRIRELGVYSEVLGSHEPAEAVLGRKPAGIVLSGGPQSVFEEGAPTLDLRILEAGVPVLGICYGMQIMGRILGGKVEHAKGREYGSARVELHEADDPLFRSLASPMDVWMSHGDHVVESPPGFRVLASTRNAPVAAMGDPERGLYGIQFHPEVAHTPRGRDLLDNFLRVLCGCSGDWTVADFVEESLEAIRRQAAGRKALCGISGGVDSAVAAVLAHEALGDDLACLFVDTGMLRKDEAAQVMDAFKDHFHIHVRRADAGDRFLSGLEGVTDPEEKRKRIGELFIRVFEEEARRLGDLEILVQGTLYPDVIESTAVRGPSAVIKSHHNVGGLPEKLGFEVMEPLRWLFKDEVRRVGKLLGVSDRFLKRHPFPGPGLAVRILGEVTPARVRLLQEADAIYLDELRGAGLYDEVQQAFAVLLPVQSVGVMGDSRTYEDVVALRAVTTEDFMTADWARLPPEMLARAANRIVNEVRGVNRVVYDITSKPPGTIEWE